MSNTEIVSLTDEQLEAVSGGAGKVYFNFKVAGMKVSAGVNDNGKTWGPMIELERGVEDDEFSYPSVISFGDTVAVTYTWKRQRIAFWTGTVN